MQIKTESKAILRVGQEYSNTHTETEIIELIQLLTTNRIVTGYKFKWIESLTEKSGTFEVDATKIDGFMNNWKLNEVAT